MNFRLEYHPTPAEHRLNAGDQVFLIGSCFTEHMYEKLVSYKFNCMQNPSGTLFNPVSIIHSLYSYVKGETIEEDELFHHQGLWRHWSFHSSLSNAEKKASVAHMNKAIANAHEFLKKAEVLFITLGSAFVYENQQGAIVANCHKVPASFFLKRLLDPNEIISAFEDFLQRLKELNPDVKIVFTVSPVRHLRDGFVENNRSKAVLIHAVDKILQRQPEHAYFPAYELVIDDLRDYRFYAEDMVHPNYQATRYVWEKFSGAFVEGKTRELMKEIDQIRLAMQHRPMHPGTDEHRKFIQKHSEMVKSLSQRYPYLDWKEETGFFDSAGA